jgi:hypothetical protein
MAMAGVTVRPVRRATAPLTSPRRPGLPPQSQVPPQRPLSSISSAAIGMNPVLPTEAEAVVRVVVRWPLRVRTGSSRPANGAATTLHLRRRRLHRSPPRPQRRPPHRVSPKPLSRRLRPRQPLLRSVCRPPRRRPVSRRTERPGPAEGGQVVCSARAPSSRAVPTASCASTMRSIAFCCPVDTRVRCFPLLCVGSASPALLCSALHVS